MSSNVILSPNMNMPVPIVGIDPGPDWANNVNSCLSIIDGHNHSLGTGVQINPSGLNINSDLSINSNNLTNLRTVRFSPQGATLSLPTDLGCIYEVGVDLYYNDGSGNQIRITQGGSVAGASGTITGLPSGTASASYSAGTFVFQSATNVPATMDAGSYIFRDLTAGSNGVTVSPVNSLGSNYNLILPLLPSVQSIMTLDAAGNMAAPYTVDGSTIVISSNVIKVGTIQDSNIAAASITSDKFASSVVGQSLNPGTQSYAGAGTYSWTVPAGVTKAQIFAAGGGGGGAGGSGSGGSTGGQGSGQTIQWVTGLTPLSSITIVVGAGGATAISGVTGNFGSDTSFNGVVVAKGGSGGTFAGVPQIRRLNHANGGTGGQPGEGSELYDGGAAVAGGTASGGGGGAGGAGAGGIAGGLGGGAGNASTNSGGGGGGGANGFGGGAGGDGYINIFY